MNTMDKIAEFLKPEFEKLEHVRIVQTEAGWVMEDTDPIEGRTYIERITDELDLVTRLLAEQELERLTKIQPSTDFGEVVKKAGEKAPEMLKELKKRLKDD